MATTKGLRRLFVGTTECCVGAACSSRAFFFLLLSGLITHERPATTAVGQKQHDAGPVEFAWDPRGKYLATCGANRCGMTPITRACALGLGCRAFVSQTQVPFGRFLVAVHIFARSGEMVDEFMLPGNGQILSLEWDKDGDVCASMQAQSSIICMWDASEKKVGVRFRARCASCLSVVVGSLLSFLRAREQPRLVAPRRSGVDFNCVGDASRHGQQ
jgi:WD40 repeat protein